jgi:CheY-like chemotaxis protein
MLPGFDGFRVLRTLRDGAAGPLAADTPVLLLTARGAEEDKVRGFRLGADDYVTKPFGASELLARVGAVEVNRSTRVVRRAGAAVALTPKEYDLLAALLDGGGGGHPARAPARGVGLPVGGVQPNRRHPRGRVVAQAGADPGGAAPHRHRVEGGVPPRAVSGREPAPAVRCRAGGERP